MTLQNAGMSSNPAVAARLAVVAGRTPRRRMWMGELSRTGLFRKPCHNASTNRPHLRGFRRQCGLLHNQMVMGRPVAVAQVRGIARVRPAAEVRVSGTKAR